MHQLPETGYLRLRQIIGDRKPAHPRTYPCQQIHRWEGVRTGRYPPSVKTLGARITVWRVEAIRQLIQEAAGDGA